LHVRCMNESCCTHMNESNRINKCSISHTCEGVMAHMWMSNIAHVWISHVAHMDESCCTHMNE